MPLERGKKDEHPVQGPRVLDYYFGLVPELDTREARARFVPVSLVDGRNAPLARKLLERPGAVRLIRELVGEPEFAMILPFCMTPDEVALAESLGIPIYGSDPSLNWLGSKTGIRRVFLEEDVRHPVGLDVRGVDDVVPALEEIRARSPRAVGAVLKLDKGVSGLGDALLDIDSAIRDLPAEHLGDPRGAEPSRVLRPAQVRDPARPPARGGPARRQRPGRGGHLPRDPIGDTDRRSAGHTRAW